MKNKKKIPLVAILFAAITGIIIFQNIDFEKNNVVEVKENTTNTLYAQTIANNSGESVVYFTKDITSSSLLKIYKKLGKELKGNIAIKIHFGESGNPNYIRPVLIKDIVADTKATLIDANTAYGGSRGSTARHLQTAKEHGFTEYADVKIIDADGEIKLPVRGGRRLTEAVLGKGYNDYDSIISVAHFKGHSMAGFGGTFKNLAVGMASGKTGKKRIHARENSVISTEDIITTEEAIASMKELLSNPALSNEFLEKVVEYNKAIIDDKGDSMLYINILNNLSVDCDCYGRSAAHPTMADIGILASTDPVALEQASLDLIYKAPDNRHLVERIESRRGAYVVDYAEAIGLGSKEYKIISID